MAKVKAIKPEKVIKALTARLEKESAKAAKWKARATDLETEIRTAAKQIRKLERRLTSSPSVAEARPAAATGPDETWTVAALRTLAKERQVPGYSRKTKAQLLSDLG